MKKIDLIIYDFDGVLTDNRVLLDQDGKEAVFCNRGDGLFMGYIKQKGLRQIIVSGETNSVVAKRAEKLKIECHQGIKDKKSFLIPFFKDQNIDSANVVYIGNELNDLDGMSLVGHPFCPNDANPKIQKISKWIIPEKGGYGIVRHLYEWLFEL